MTVPPRVRDVTGQRFDRLLAESYAGKQGGRHSWLCRCRCGESCTVSNKNLVSGHTASCGCISRERFNDRQSAMSNKGSKKSRKLKVGMRFGRLVLTEVYPIKALCDCGTLIDVRTSGTLRVGDVQSCGCLKKENGMRKLQELARRHRVRLGRDPDVLMTPAAKAERERYRSTVGKAVMARDDYTCKLCGVRGLHGLHTHHLSCWRDHENLRFDPSNVVTLCRPCHIDRVHRGNVHAEPCPELTEQLRSTILGS